MTKDIGILLGAGAMVVLLIIAAILVLAVIVGAAFEYLIENVLLQRGVDLFTWATFWKGLAFEILFLSVKGNWHESSD